MFKALVEIKSIAPVSFNGPIKSAKLDNETNDEHERRSWRERCGLYGNGQTVKLEGIRFKNAFDVAAQHLAIKIPGKGNSTYTKNFHRGLLVTNEIDTGVLASEIPGEWFLVPTDGKRGSGKSKVMKCFPYISEWGGILEITILDDVITQKVFKEVIESAGLFIGIGRYRPENRGDKGRFKVLSYDFEKV